MRNSYIAQFWRYCIILERKESESDSAKQESDSESESIKRNRQDSTKQESDSNWIRELDSRIGFDKKRIENAHPYTGPYSRPIPEILLSKQNFAEH